MRELYKITENLIYDMISFRKKITNHLKITSYTCDMDESVDVDRKIPVFLPPPSPIFTLPGPSSIEEFLLRLRGRPGNWKKLPPPPPLSKESSLPPPLPLLLLPIPLRRIKWRNEVMRWNSPAPLCEAFLSGCTDVLLRRAASLMVPPPPTPPPIIGGRLETEDCAERFLSRWFTGGGCFRRRELGALLN